MSSAIKVVLADDHPLFLHGTRTMLEEAPDITVLGQAGNVTRALALITQLQPAVAVLDIAMPELNGIEVARRVAESALPTWTVILSNHEDRAYVQRALAAGARGYVLKRSAGDALVHAIRAVSSSGVYLDPTIAGQYLNRDPGSAASLPSRFGPTTTSLTEREKEIVRLIAFGFTSKEIAGRLAITSKSVETYKARACEKLGLRSRAKLVQYAVLEGWLQDLPN